MNTKRDFISSINRFLLVVSAFFLQATLSKTVTVTLIFSEDILSPDNYEQPGILINGQFPGPPIVARKGDFLVLHVVNALSKRFALHLHGLFQYGTIEYDGVPEVTQDFINPNSTFTHRVDLRHQTGTYIYHAHSDMDLVWAFGSLIIEGDEEYIRRNIQVYTEERTLMLTQCWHTPLAKILDGLMSQELEDVPPALSLLINGRSWGKWNNSSSNRIGHTRSNRFPGLARTHSEGYEVINVLQNETYRFRIIGLPMDGLLSFSIQNHTNLQIVEVDGTIVNPIPSSYLSVNSGQRYSILVTMDQPIGNYWIHTAMFQQGPGNGKAILHYAGAPDPGLLRKALFHPEIDGEQPNNWITDQFRPLHIEEMVNPAPSTVDQDILISSTERIDLSDNKTKFDINGIFHRHSGPSLLHQVLAGVDITKDRQNGVHEVFIGKGIQIVFQNHVNDEGICEQHPWHTHGHKFYTVGHGPDKYDPEKDGKVINEAIRARNPFSFPMRDVVTLLPAQTIQNNSQGAPCGWTAIRFIADNPGIWFVHCHLTAHHIMGKWFVLYEHEENSSFGLM